jgi:hypothetical protein
MSGLGANLAQEDETIVTNRQQLSTIIKHKGKIHQNANHQLNTHDEHIKYITL